MKESIFESEQGHWVLAKLGKRVLRPGGKELTQKLIEGMQINSTDDVTEFAPGMGYTANITINKHPHSYIGIDASEQVVKNLSQKFNQNNSQFKLANAADTQLESQSKNKVYGEAMLTMHADHRKAEIIREAYRILKKGGLYGIHELGLKNVDDTLKAQVQKDLALAIKVNARPLTEEEWTLLLEKEGFKVKKVYKNNMSLLETKRVIKDEGLLRTLKIGLNFLLHSSARKRVIEMKKVFTTYKDNMNAIAIIAEKQ